MHATCRSKSGRRLKSERSGGETTLYCRGRSPWWIGKEVVAEIIQGPSRRFEVAIARGFGVGEALKVRSVREGGVPGRHRVEKGNSGVGQTRSLRDDLEAWFGPQRLAWTSSEATVNVMRFHSWSCKLIGPYPLLRGLQLGSHRLEADLVVVSGVLLRFAFGQIDSNCFLYSILGSCNFNSPVAVRPLGEKYFSAPSFLSWRLYHPSCPPPFYDILLPCTKSQRSPLASSWAYRK